MHLYALKKTCMLSFLAGMMHADMRTRSGSTCSGMPSTSNREMSSFSVSLTVLYSVFQRERQ